MQRLHKLKTIILRKLSLLDLNSVIVGKRLAFSNPSLSIQPQVGRIEQPPTHALLQMGEVFRKIILQLQKGKKSDERHDCD